MGSFAKNDVFSDVNLNFFVHENNSKVIKNVRKMIDYFFNSKLFIHRNRHSMILYELKCLDNNSKKVYWYDIIKLANKYNYKYYSVYIESNLEDVKKD